MQSETSRPDSQSRRYELVDFDSFAGTSENTEQDQQAPDLSASGRLIWTWESLDEAANASQGEDEPSSAVSDEDAPESDCTDSGNSDTEPDTSAARTRTHSRRRRPAQPRTEPSAEAAYRFYTKSVYKTGSRTSLAALLCIVAAYGTLAACFGWWLPAAFSGIGRYILSVLLLLQLIVCCDVLIRAVYDLSCGRFGTEGLTVLTAFVTLADALTCADTAVPYCAVPMVGLFFGLWGLCQSNAAMRRTVKVISGADEPDSAVCFRNHQGVTDCMLRTQCPTSGFILDLENSDLCRNVLSVYSPIAALLALLLALISSLHASTPYLTCCSAILCGALPAAGAIGFSRPFALLAKALSQAGAALCGWAGAQVCRRTGAVILTDEDLMPEGSVRNSGLKVYNSYTPGQVLGCCGAVLAHDGGRLYDAVLPLLQQSHSRIFECGDYRAYEGGGLGAEVQGSIVLVGSLSFMRLMGVRLPEGVSVRQALYVSINAELAGVIGIRYTPTASVRSALRTLQGCRDLKLILATRDFLLTPAFVRQCFRLQSDRFVYPSMADRIALCTPDDGAESSRAAVFSTHGLRPMARALVGGRQLNRLTRINAGCSLTGGILGLLLLFSLTFTGSVYSLNAGNVLLYAAVWTLPSILLSRWAGEK